MLPHVRRYLLLVAACVPAVPAVALYAQHTEPAVSASVNLTSNSAALPAAPYSSSTAAIPAAPAPAMAATSRAAAVPSEHMAPFSAVAVGVRAGLLGVGFEVATPLSRRFNLRAGGNFFGYNDTFTTNGIVYGGNLHLRSADASLDWYPWAKGFRVSPGALLYNGNNISGGANVPGGNLFSLNDVEYQSSTTDPVTGNATLKFNKAAPELTVGFGNHIPRSGRHFSMPFEIGFAYIGDPKLTLNLQGTACSPQGLYCQDVATTTEIQSNLKAQQEKYQKDADDARFFPVVSVGFDYSF
jgi:hypothetical protein